MSRSRLRQSRRGYSLIEMVAIIAVTSMLMSIVATTLVTMLRLGHASGERVAWQATWHRLMNDFRDDAHAATSASSAGPVRFLYGVDGAVVYRATERAIEREEFRGGGPPATESYALPEAYAAKLSLEEGTSSQMAVIALARTADSTEAPIAVATQPLVITALVGRDWRLTALVAGEESP
jgi:hypothetical protein